MLDTPNLPWCFFAEASPDPAFVGNFILAVVVIGNIISVGVSIIAVWLSSRRQPPIAEEAFRTFIPRDEYAEGIQRVHDRVDETNNSLAEASLKMAKACGDLERAIGRLEGKIDQNTKQWRRD